MLSTRLIYLSCEDGTEHLRKFQKGTSIDSEILTSMIGAEILKRNTIRGTDTVGDAETAQ